MTDTPNDVSVATSGVESTTNHGTVANDLARALARATGSDVTEIPPAGERVDMDAVTSLVESGDETLSISFEHADHEVLITGDGGVDVSPRRSTPERR